MKEYQPIINLKRPSGYNNYYTNNAALNPIL